ncbi:hypothetical protein LSTR_LSTR003787 [Laodelphax striatellus]|uniref:Uncharacterized protein n=1 Tax=Laodelphax striatellus TaxID=195883 RepID=A0A482XEL8_LAOST|nr:hypothetical protein LSTR_LSTR003787 [Laodelphax striatellus]
MRGWEIGLSRLETRPPFEEEPIAASITKCARCGKQSLTQAARNWSRINNDALCVAPFRRKIIPRSHIMCTTEPEVL